MIETGWKVLAVDGTHVGGVDEVVGDDTEDIFDGLAIATSALGKPRYVPAEQVAEITDGSVRLSLTPDQVAALGEYLEPATSAVIEPDSKGGVGRDAPRGRARGGGEGRRADREARAVDEHLAPDRVLLQAPLSETGRDASPVAAARASSSFVSTPSVRRARAR